MSLRAAPPSQGEIMKYRSGLGGTWRVLATLFAGVVFVVPALARSDEAESKPAASQMKADAAAAAGGAAPAAARKTSPHRSVKVTNKAKNYYQAVWGIDRLKVTHTASGNLIRFSYRVNDPERAKTLGEKSATPYLLGQKSRALLHIPVMDKVGQLRQTGNPQSGMEYWMVFSNKGNLVKPGDRVNVMIGSFHADGLMVE
jgi:hypothetical protein